MKTRYLLSGFTTILLIAGALLDEYPESPAYSALRLWVPAESCVVIDAVPIEAVPKVSIGALPSVVAPSVNVTRPEGGVAPPTAT